MNPIGGITEIAAKYFVVNSLKRFMVLFLVVESVTLLFYTVCTLEHIGIGAQLSCLPCQAGYGTIYRMELHWRVNSTPYLQEAFAVVELHGHRWGLVTIGIGVSLRPLCPRCEHPVMTLAYNEGWRTGCSDELVTEVSGIRLHSRLTEPREFSPAALFSEAADQWEGSVEDSTLHDFIALNGENYENCILSNQLQVFMESLPLDALTDVLPKEKPISLSVNKPNYTLSPLPSSTTGIHSPPFSRAKSVTPVRWSIETEKIVPRLGKCLELN